jgi:hypothetical protein
MNADFCLIAKIIQKKLRSNRRSRILSLSMDVRFASCLSDLLDRLH